VPKRKLHPYIRALVEDTVVFTSADPDGNPHIPVLNSFTIGPHRPIPILIGFTRNEKALTFIPSY
jgi:hypothetical protein